MVAKFSIVGADDSVCPQDLADISVEYPFVEWGVNLCPDSEQKPEYPSEEWLEELLQYSKVMRLRAILHGRWERDILDGGSSFKIERPDIWNAFRWIQVDSHKKPKDLLSSLLSYPNKIILKSNFELGIKANILLPRSKVFSCNEYCGYSILESDLNWINRSVPSSFWVSVEGFRSEDLVTMELDRVHRFLEEAENYVTHSSLMKSIQNKYKE